MEVYNNRYSLIELLGFKKKKSNRIASANIYVNSYIPSLKIEHYKETDEIYLILDYSDGKSKYMIEDISNPKEILIRLSEAYYSKGYNIGKQHMRKDIASVLGLNKLIDDKISVRIDNLVD